MSKPFGPDTIPVNAMGPWHFGHGGRSISVRPGSLLNACGMGSSSKIRREHDALGHRPAEVMCGDRPTMLFRVPKLWSILLTLANYERGTVRSVRGSDARSGGALWPKLPFSRHCLLILLIAALLLVSPLTAPALTPRYNVRKGSGRYLAMLVRLRLAALPISRSANSTISICSPRRRGRRGSAPRCCYPLDRAQMRRNNSACADRALRFRLRLP
jgi:hypothetical protein